MSSPVLWGPNNIANNLQNQQLLASGALVAWNGPKNYITYGNFENQATTGWSLGTVGTLTNGLPTGTPTFGSGAAGTLSLAVVTSSQLAGTASLSYADTNASGTTAGNMVASQSYAIDSEDQAKVLTVKFYYSIPTGSAGANFSGTSSNSFAWAVWDVTNSAWLSSAGNFNLVQKTGVGYATGTFQTASTTANIRLVIYNANATTAATTLYFDDIFVGPQTAPSGPAMSDWTSYTPTFSGLGTVTGASAYYKRVGDTVMVSGTFTTGTVAASVASISLPSGLNIDSTKLGLPSGTTSNQGNLLGQAVQAATSAYANRYYNILGSPGTSTSVVYLSDNLGDTGGGFSIAVASASGAVSSSTSFVFFFSAPVVGWSSNTAMSSDTDTRVVAMVADGTPANFSSLNPIIYPTVVTDTHGGYSAVTGKYTVPVTGYYQCSATVQSNTSTVNMYFYVNGAQYGSVYGVIPSSGNSTATGVVYATAGQTIDVRIAGNSTSQGNGTFSINRLSGPAVIAATESVNGRYYSSSTSVSGSLATIVYATKGWDTHGAYNNSTGIWTCPVTGKYQFNCNLDVSATLILNNTLDVQIQQAGSSSQISEETVYAGGAVTALSASFGDEFYCLAGDTVKVQASSSGTSPSIVSSNSKNYISWTRVGN